MIHQIHITKMPAAASNSLLGSRATWKPRNSSVHGNSCRQVISRDSTFSSAMGAPCPVRPGPDHRPAADAPTVHLRVIHWTDGGGNGAGRHSCPWAETPAGFAAGRTEWQSVLRGWG